MHGKIDQAGSITGNLNPSQQIKGNLNQSQQVKGKIQFPHIIPPDVYDGETVIVPSSFSDKELETRGKMVKTDIVVKQIPYYETANETGKTIYIGNEDLIIFEGGN